MRAVMFLALLPACIFVIPDNGDFPPGRPDHSTREREILPEDLTELELILPAGDVEIQVGTDLAIDISLGWRGDLDDEPRLMPDMQNGRASYAWTCSPRTNCTIDLVVTVPPELVSLVVDLDAGDVDLIDLSGAADVRVDAGDVTVDGHTGDLVLDVDAGSISGLDLASEMVSAYVDAGSVDLELAVRPVEVIAATDTGNVTIDVPAGEYALDTSLDVGNLTVEGIVDEPGADAAITATVDVGNITIRGY